MGHPSFAELVATTRATNARRSDPVFYNGQQVTPSMVWPTARMAKLGEGISRSAYVVGPDHIVKVAHETPQWTGRDRCIGANKDEVDFWKSVRPSDRIYLTQPFVWARDFSWVVFERVENFPNGFDDAQTMNEWLNLRHVMAQYGRDDIHQRNTGVRVSGGRRQMVVLDYAW